ncbi:trigger factor [Capnocytophaga canis]|uniref:Peptidyl-prolyl cis-trans isomerase, trigger factor n=1 Tax=Capnocytophaga canis TaxID=1848903 RepID=A0A0B7IVW1_9FLAO|nr:trigger factor [Capnocytophaga canis]CEN54192.1 Peptidyl-prolyl cis-trans isomerase, trigger factor [Capnocytophaga canis]
MNITKEQIDALNAVITVAIEKDDYADKVEKVLTNYRKTANVPGFRKGHVPMGMIRKQYGKAILFDEVNKLLQDSLNKYIVEEKLDILGNPLPKEQQDFNWDAESFTFEFEVGLAPKFELDLQPQNGITRYEISIEDELIDRQVERIRKQFGKLISKGEVLDQNDIEITGSFFNEEKNIDNQATFKLEALSADNRKVFVGKKIGDQLQLQTKGLFNDEHDLMHFLKVSHDDVHHLDVTVTFTIEEVNVREEADLNQELFDKLFPAGTVTSETELREEIKKNSQFQYTEQADQHFLNQVTDYLVNTTQFDLPAEFLKKWLRTAGEKELTKEEADAEYEKSEKGLRYQLIEGKILGDNNLHPTFDELKDYANSYVKNQLVQYGMPVDDDSYIDGIVSKILQNKEEIQRINQQLVLNKLLEFYKANVKTNTKKATFDEFIKEVYKTDEA